MKIPTWMWLLIGGGVVYLLTRSSAPANTPTSTTQTSQSVIPTPFGPAEGIATAGGTTCLPGQVLGFDGLCHQVRV